MLQALRICLVVLGVSAIAIALSILTVGAAATATMGEGVFNAVSGWRGPPSEPWPPTMDSELRFYSALWGAYGVVALGTARNLTRRLPRVPWLAAVFFAGGLGRALSRLAVGPPHPFFTLLMVIELSLPVLMTLLWIGARVRGASQGSARTSGSPARRPSG